MSRKKLVSIIIPAYNEEKVIARLLSSLKKQSYIDIEIIVVDDSSIDSTAKIARKFAQKVYIRQHAERSVQRNFGSSKARGEYFLFLDADMELTKDVVKACVEKVKKDSKVGAVVIPEESVATNFWEKVKAFERSFYNLEGYKITDAARFFTKEAFKKAGGYDEAITGPEDWDLPDMVRRRGFKTERVKELIFHYERVPNPIRLAKKKYYYALKSYRYLEKQNIPAVGPKTIYFLRGIFYKNWQKFLEHPILSIGLIFMLSLELLGGGLGYIIGKLQNR